MFDLIDVLLSVCLVNKDNYKYKSGTWKKLKNTCKGGRSSNFLNEVVD